uniref:Uncharacterized protein n=1 Tax=Attheya septentrionalis TaxID=420275 RepID=A0A7S2UFG6_9STRA
MDRAEKDETPAAVWQASLNATCNRLSTQYLNLLRSASSAAALDPGLGGQDPRAGGGAMKDVNEPPPPLAADAAMSSLQAKLATQNLAVASAHLLDLIRTLRLSALLMEQTSIEAEQEDECQHARIQMSQAMEASDSLEAQIMALRNQTP